MHFQDALSMLICLFTASALTAHSVHLAEEPARDVEPQKHYAPVSSGQPLRTTFEHIRPPIPVDTEEVARLQKRVSEEDILDSIIRKCYLANEGLEALYVPSSIVSSYHEMDDTPVAEVKRKLKEASGDYMATKGYFYKRIILARLFVLNLKNHYAVPLKTREKAEKKGDYNYKLKLSTGEEVPGLPPLSVEGYPPGLAEQANLQINMPQHKDLLKITEQCKFKDRVALMYQNYKEKTVTELKALREKKKNNRREFEAVFQFLTSEKEREGEESKVGDSRDTEVTKGKLEQQQQQRQQQSLHPGHAAAHPQQSDDKETQEYKERNQQLIGLPTGLPDVKIKQGTSELPGELRNVKEAVPLHETGSSSPKLEDLSPHGMDLLRKFFGLAHTEPSEGEIHSPEQLSKGQKGPLEEQKLEEHKARPHHGDSTSSPPSTNVKGSPNKGSAGRAAVKEWNQASDPHEGQSYKTELIKPSTMHIPPGRRLTQKQEADIEEWKKVAELFCSTYFNDLDKEKFGGFIGYLAGINYEVIGNCGSVNIPRIIDPEDKMVAAARSFFDKVRKGALEAQNKKTKIPKKQLRDQRVRFGFLKVEGECNTHFKKDEETESKLKEDINKPHIGSEEPQGNPTTQASAQLRETESEGQIPDPVKEPAKLQKGSENPKAGVRRPSSSSNKWEKWRKDREKKQAKQAALTSKLEEEKQKKAEDEKRMEVVQGRIEEQRKAMEMKERKKEVEKRLRPYQEKYPTHIGQGDSVAASKRGFKKLEKISEGDEHSTQGAEHDQAQKSQNDANEKHSKSLERVPKSPNVKTSPVMGDLKSKLLTVQPTGQPSTSQEGGTLKDGAGSPTQHATASDMSKTHDGHKVESEPVQQSSSVFYGPGYPPLPMGPPPPVQAGPMRPFYLGPQPLFHGPFFHPLPPFPFGHPPSIYPNPQLTHYAGVPGHPVPFPQKKQRQLDTDLPLSGKRLLDLLQQPERVEGHSQKPIEKPVSQSTSLDKKKITEKQASQKPPYDILKAVRDFNSLPEKHRKASEDNFYNDIKGRMTLNHEFQSANPLKITAPAFEPKSTTYPGGQARTGQKREAGSSQSTKGIDNLSQSLRKTEDIPQKPMKSPSGKLSTTKFPLLKKQRSAYLSKTEPELEPQRKTSQLEQVLDEMTPDKNNKANSRQKTKPVGTSDDLHIKRLGKTSQPFFPLLQLDPPVEYSRQPTQPATEAVIGKKIKATYQYYSGRMVDLKQPQFPELQKGGADARVALSELESSILEAAKRIDREIGPPRPTVGFKSIGAGGQTLSKIVAAVNMVLRVKISKLNQDLIVPHIAVRNILVLWAYGRVHLGVKSRPEDPMRPLEKIAI